MSTLVCYDAAFPPSNPPNANVVCGYIGGDTPHIWSVSDWNSQPARYRLPIYTRSNPPGPGAVSDLAAALAQLEVLGAPSGCLVAWDLEMAIDSVYVEEIAAGLEAAGYKLIIYGSLNDVLQNNNPDGYYWGADWTGVPFMAAGCVMTQYESLFSYDVSLANGNLPFWDTKAPVNPWPLSAGDTGPNVVILQRGLNKWRYANPLLTTDGVFGSLTLAAVENAQRTLKLPVTGIVDETLWNELLTNPPPPPPPDPLYGAPKNLKAAGGLTSVKLTYEPPGTAGLPAPSEYEIYIYKGSVADKATLVPSYPRVVSGLVFKGGSLVQHTEYTAHVVAAGPGGTKVKPGTYASVIFTTS